MVTRKLLQCDFSSLKSSRGGFILKEPLDIAYIKLVTDIFITPPNSHIFKQKHE